MLTGLSVPCRGSVLLTSSLCLLAVQPGPPLAVSQIAAARRRGQVAVEPQPLWSLRAPTPAEGAQREGGVG